MSWRIIDIKPGDPVPHSLVFRFRDRGKHQDGWIKWEGTIQHPSDFSQYEFAVPDIVHAADQQTRRQAWIQFAAASLNAPDLTYEACGKWADEMLAEFDKRVKEGLL